MATMFLTGILYLAVAVSTDPSTLPPGEGQATVQQKCVSCHALKVITEKRASKEQWTTIVNQMITRGADVEDDDVDTLINYLSKNFGLATDQAGAEKTQKTDRVNVNTATAAELAASLDLTEQESASIVSYRQQNGNFKEWRDLIKVPGIDARKIENNKDRLLF